jgi:TonB family protein
MIAQRLAQLLCFCFLALPVFLDAQESLYKKCGRNVIRDSLGNCAVGRTKNYLREGTWKETYAGGTTKRTGKYHLGFPEGLHTAYWPNGEQQEIAVYTNGKRNGIYALFDFNGDTVQHSYYSQGEPLGYHYKLDTVNQTWMRGELNGAMRTGTWTVNTGDSLIVCQYVSGKRNGSIRIELPGNRAMEGFYTNDTRDSVWRMYHDGALSREYWLTNGKPYKTEKIFFPHSDSVYCETRYHAADDPSMFIVYQRPGVPGKTEWYSEHYVDSILQFFPDGKVQSRSVFTRDLTTGDSNLEMCCAYDTSGKELFRAYCFTDGTDSVRFDYNALGTVERKTEYNHGRPFSTTYYYDSGKLKLKISSEGVSAFTESGHRMRAGSAAYTRLFFRIDSTESHYASIQLFADPYAPEPPVSTSGPDLSETYIGHDEPYRNGGRAIEKIPESPLTYAEVMPAFPGELNTYLKTNIRYPEAEREQNLQGTVYIQFVVETDGRVTGVQVLKEVSGAPGLTAEALRVVNSMPKWTPASQNGRNVRCIVRIPIKFSLR